MGLGRGVIAPQILSVSKTIFVKTPWIINTSYLTDSYIGFTLKMESVSKNTIFGLKMMVKNYFEIPPCGKMIIFITEFVILDTFMK